MPTYAPSTSFTWLGIMLKGMDIDQILPNILDDTNKLLWMAAPWRWTLGVLDAVTVPANPTGDLAIGTLPADFLYGYKAWITSTSNAGTPRPLEVVGGLSDDVSVRGVPTQLQIIGDAGGAGTARLYPYPTGMPTGSQLFIIYKKTAPIITKANMGTGGVLVMPDEYSPVYNMGLMYYGYLYADDQRAGAAQMQDQRITTSGAWGMFQSMIQGMRVSEKLPLADDRPQDKKMDKG